MRRTTLHDIAKAAGVGVPTVDRAYTDRAGRHLQFSKHQRVTPE